MAQQDFLLNPNPFDFPREQQQQPFSPAYNVNAFGRMANEGTNRALQEAIEKLTQTDQEAVNTVWSIFSASNGHRRRLILTGLLTICCPSQLTFLTDSLRAACRTDPFSRLPKELSLRILSYFDAFSLGRAAQVSKLWKKLADDDLLWREMCQQHIERTCQKCGWGLPSMQKRKRSPSLPSSHQQQQTQTQRPWKSVYTERLALERNWRKGSYVESVLTGHTDSITCLQFEEDLTSPSFPILMTGSWDRTIRIWNVDRQECVQVLHGHARGIKCLQFDSHKLISGAMDHTLKIWNWRTGECSRTILGHNAPVTCLHFDHQLLASGSADGSIRIWDFSSGAGFVLRGHTEWVNTVRLDTKSAPPGAAPFKLLYSGSDDGTVRLWNLAARQTLKVLHGHVAQDGAEVRVEGSCERTLFGHIQGVWSIDADKLRIVSASHDRSLKIWDRLTGKCVHTFVGHRGAVSAVKLTDDKIISGGDDGEVRIWWFGPIAA
ncbi:hypothetical protein PtA15_13A359 [Puccinia triticina]|uniref:F-box domain-containing protein n=1 Tax=Puccinia triticina TaxID=208348 RepID=A0ABY7D058_9BASI|nr:uncharacterized protein PtA15_13A359 [Puccinia triticina]WAQ90959.1 hypothetical protein PtA15_13A359 [Puccinia triticina]WAR61147.1 hypothetical protein PtB15_13B399 [Puccinia triticina]